MPRENRPKSFLAVQGSGKRLSRKTADHVAYKFPNIAAVSVVMKIFLNTENHQLG